MHAETDSAQQITMCAPTFPRFSGGYGLPWWLSGKESTCQCRSHRLAPKIGKTPWRRECQLTPVFLPGKSHGQWSLWGLQKSQTGLGNQTIMTTRSYKVASAWVLSSEMQADFKHFSAWPLTTSHTFFNSPVLL